MPTDLLTIPIGNLAIAFVPALIVIAIMYRWTAAGNSGLHAIGRMLLQLVLIGYALNWIFAIDSAWLVLSLLAAMLCIASWIALRPLKETGWQVFGHASCAIAVGGCFTLALIITLVLQPQPWYQPRVTLPLAGMIFGSAMNAVSLAAERLNSELASGHSTADARSNAFQAALIPMLNALFAVGLVSLPGMMTGQILSGVDPLIAVRYQIMVMCMLTGASGIAAAVYLTLTLRTRSQNS